MRRASFFMAGLSALALAACGQDGGASDAPKSAASVAAAKSDSASPLEKDFKLKGGEEIDVAALFALLGDDAAPTYDAATFDKNTGATVVTNLKFADTDDGEGMRVARAEFYGVDMEAIEAVKASEGGDAAAPFKPIFEKVRLFDLSAEGFEDNDGALTIGAVEFDQFAIRESGVEGDGVGDEGARALNAMQIAGVYVKDIEMSSQEEDAPAIAFTVPDLRIVGVGGGKVSAFIANGVKYEAKQSAESLAAIRTVLGPQAGALLNGPLAGILAAESQSGDIETFEWRDIDFSGLLAYGLKGEEPPLTEKDLLDLGEMKMTGLSSFLEGRRVSFLEEATVSSMEFTWLAPSKIRMDAKGAVYDFSAYAPVTETQTIAALKEHGLDKVEADAFIDWEWNDKTGVAKLDYATDYKNVADIAMSVDMSGLKLADLAAAKETGDDNLIASHAKLGGVSFKITDEKALDAIFSVAALQMGGSGDDLRQSAPAMIRLSGVQAAQMNEKFPAYINAFADFVANGGALEIAMKPAEPVALSALQGARPDTLPDLLALEVAHSE